MRLKRDWPYFEIQNRHGKSWHAQLDEDNALIIKSDNYSTMFGGASIIIPTEEVVRFKEFLEEQLGLELVDEIQGVW